MKLCSKCGVRKDFSEFYKVKANKDGFAGHCKSCWKLSVNKERRNAYEREYWSRPENKDRRREMIKRSVAKNADHHKRVRDEYLKTDQGINAQRKSGQVHRCKAAGVYVEDISPIELYNQQGGICYICFCKFSFKDMEMDHIIPISKGGKHESNNVKMCCGTCNRKKSVKLLKEII